MALYFYYHNQSVQEAREPLIDSLAWATTVSSYPSLVIIHTSLFCLCELDSFLSLIFDYHQRTTESSDLCQRVNYFVKLKSMSFMFIYLFPFYYPRHFSSMSNMLMFYKFDTFMFSEITSISAPWLIVQNIFACVYVWVLIRMQKNCSWSYTLKEKKASYTRIMIQTWTKNNTNYRISRKVAFTTGCSLFLQSHKERLYNLVTW